MHEDKNWKKYAPPPEVLMGDMPTDELPSKKPKKKKSRFKRFLAWTLAVLLVIFGSMSTVAFFAAGRMNITDVDAEHRAIARGPRSRPWVTTILIIGVDGSPTNSRADTLMLLTIDHRTQSLKLTSILRDSWVEFPGGTFRKINEVTVGRNGGGALAMHVVSKNFTVRIDHYMLFSFEVFRTIIDSIGGISVPITPAEINALVRDTRLGRQIGRASMEQQMRDNGVVRLTGEQALIYVRIRQRDTDMDRARRQRTMMNAVLSRVASNPLRLIPLLNNALPGIHTSITQFNAAMLALGAPLYAVQAMRLQEHQLPARVQSSTRHGMFVFLVDIEENRRLLREFIYG
jgi:LCP family protein required for cell wall assembly